MVGSSSSHMMTTEAPGQQLAPTVRHVSQAILEFPGAPALQLTPDEAEESPVNTHYHGN